MVKPVRGSIVLVSFPFSDLSRSKLRPALVIAEAGRGDYILCQITSNRGVIPTRSRYGRTLFLPVVFR